MTYEEIQQLNPPQFKRYCGVSRETFQAMVTVLKPHLDRTGKKGGQSKLSVEDHLLITLEYWREYRTQFHIAQSWGIHESTACRIVRKVEDLLIGSGIFRLPGKRQLLQSEQSWDVVVVDVSETPIERPKKTAAIL
jgi:Helix-turn-helix of DDE superfamily endonuclease